MKRKFRLVTLLLVGFLLSFPLLSGGLIATSVPNEHMCDAAPVILSVEAAVTSSEEVQTVSYAQESLFSSNMNDDLSEATAVLMFMALLIFVISFSIGFLVLHIFASIRVSDYGGSGVGYFFLGWIYIACSEVAEGWSKFDKTIGVLLGIFGESVGLDVYVLVLLKKNRKNNSNNSGQTNSGNSFYDDMKNL